ncbi:YfbM family protein [Allorhizocola rhizosphaerae]|uniref:YfbM family protein n=1 Tax=Allorhizocola rhizosphaerae TaxID=1872709 RepID=UPI0013C2A867|nr:YfbM family protein [Allorhizocola rhizosphaerae]
MGSLGVHYAIESDVVADLLAADDDEEVAAVIERIEEEMIGVDHCDTDKAWDAIHRSLTDGYLAYDNGGYPLNAAILGGRQVYEGDDYIVSLLSPEQVDDVAAALADVSRERLRAGYDAIDAGDYGPEFGDDDFEYTWHNFRDLVDFFQRSAKTGAHVIFTVDQ